MRSIELTAAGQVERMGHTSKGDQPKWQIGDTWYKADHMGYESLSEVLAARMLARSTLSDFVSYEPVLIQVDHQPLPGCASKNFRGAAETLIPLERLHRAFQGDGLSKTVGHLPTVEDRIRYTVDFVEKVTGLTGFGRYLGTILELDAFLLNEDRHTNNLAVIRSEETGLFRLCPIFDNGLSLLSDTRDYPIDADVYACIGRVESKPFSTRFDEQAEAAACLYGSDLRFLFTARDIPQLLLGLDEVYDQETLRRVETVLREQMRRYAYLFSGGGAR
jgi:hypothetical protein